MCVCMHVCMYVCMCVCVHVYACMHACMYVCMYVCMHVCMYVCIYVCMYRWRHDQVLRVMNTTIHEAVEKANKEKKKGPGKTPLFEVVQSQRAT